MPASGTPQPIKPGGLMSRKLVLSRRALVQGAAGSALLRGMPAISRAQSDTIKIGHLTPRTGFLGPLGDFAVQGIQLAAEEINAAGGVGRSEERRVRKKG